MNKARLAVDIGGTFTDVAIKTPDNKRITAKVLTTPRAPEKGVLEGVKAALDRASLIAQDVGAIIHGTTLATNALIERRGAKTALLTTEGHRDALEMAYENRFEQYDINIDRPEPLVPRWLRLPVRERMDRNGAPLIPLCDDSVRATLNALDEEGVESVAIGFLHAYANPEHERRAADIIAKARPGLSLTLASEVAPEIREYERLSTAVANAYVRPLMERYLRRLDTDLKALGFDCSFLLMTSGGGLTTLETAARHPIRLVESGPAGGAVLAAAIARDFAERRALSFDMGGTTAKICLIDDYEPLTARTFEVDRRYRFKKGSGLPVRIPVIEMVEIGAGGGSIAHVDRMGRVQVGPESAGSEPGPAIYGRGGKRATVSDADAALGRLAPDYFAGGSMTLDLDAGRAAIASDIGAPLGFSGDPAAFAITEVVDENMATAARAHAVEWGKDIAARTMIAFGGAAPLHAARLAEKLSVEKVIIPTGAGVGSAIGFLLAPPAFEVVRSRPVRLDGVDCAMIAGLFEDMREEACAVLGPAVGDAPLTEAAQAYMRYRGQGHEIPVAFDPAIVSNPDFAGRLKDAFEQQYERLYGRTIPGMDIEALTWALTVTGPSPAKGGAVSPKAAPPRPGARSESRSVFDGSKEGRIEYRVHNRNELALGAEVEGPALILEEQTTTVITSVFNAHISASGEIVLTRRQSG